MTFAVSPGDSCYDSSHSPGETHYRLWFPGMSNAETSCLAGNLAINLQNPQNLTPGVPVGYNWETGQVDVSNTTGATQNPTQEDIQAAFGVLTPSVPNASASAALCAEGQTQYCKTGNWFCDTFGWCSSADVPWGWIGAIGGGLLLLSVLRR